MKNRSQCEQCGSFSSLKMEGLFVCKRCGNKFTPNKKKEKKDGIKN